MAPDAPARPTWAGPESARSGVVPDRESVAPSGPDPLVGLVVAGRYRIVEPIGRGGMGVVYKAEHRSIGKILALKLLAGELSRDRELVGRFKREALAASRLSHPNTVQVFDFGSADGLTYLAMEYLPGLDLGRVLRQQGALAFGRLGKIMIQVCGSLAEAHGAGIVHRDLKPENVIVQQSPDGEDFVKVLDFGLAKLREAPDLNEVTSAGAIVGTPYYMSPEQIRGENVDQRADVYALGALMYRALTGLPPFAGETPMAVLTRHLTEPLVPPAARVPQLSIPAEASDIVVRAMQKERDRRYQNVDELRTALLEELRKIGMSQLELLLDSSQLRHMERAAGARAQVDGAAQAKASVPPVATRDEVDAYEGKLRRQHWLLRGTLVVVLGAGAGVIAHEWRTARAPKPFDGMEREPNNQASDAQAVPYGASVRGQIGRRIDPQRSDRDFYAFDVPASGADGAALVRLQTTALPNMATCTLVYRAGLDSPLGSYCPGRPARDTVVEALRLERGRYLVGVMQDRDPYGALAAIPVHENVSDFYVLDLGPAAAQDGREVEPNDAPATATTVEVGREVRGVLGWMKDEDWVCAAAAQPPASVRFTVRDADKRPRDPGVVLEVLPRGGPKDGVVARVHRTGTQAPGKPPATGTNDFVAPWTSAPAPADGPARACVRLRLAADPWSGGDPNVVPAAGPEEWVVRVEAAH